MVIYKIIGFGHTISLQIGDVWCLATSNRLRNKIMLSARTSRRKQSGYSGGLLLLEKFFYLVEINSWPNNLSQCRSTSNNKQRSRKERGEE